MMKIAVIDYNAGNVNSVQGALQRLGQSFELTRDPQKILAADKVIFPGVGEASTTMEFLRELELEDCLKSVHRPFLGICLGMQLMCKYSEENDTECLGIFDLPVKKFVAKDIDQKIPHVGWNQLVNLKSDLFNKTREKEHCYFVHSYFVPDNEYTIASCDYIQRFSAAIQRDNFYATQFHPEKSGLVGETILNQFLAL